MLSSLQAKSVFAKMPYGMEFGKEVPLKVEKRSTSEEEYISKDKKIKRYTLENKFIYYKRKGALLDKLVFQNKVPHILPRKWQELGLKLCTPTESGITYKNFTTILNSEVGAKYINHKVFNNWDIVEFEMDGKYLYKFLFAIGETKKILDCKTGLYEIEISGDVLDEEY